jgi:CheY-like chemotaxis protein
MVLHKLLLMHGFLLAIRIDCCFGTRGATYLHYHFVRNKIQKKAAPPMALSSKNVSHANALSSPSLPCRTILLVDDEPSILQVRSLIFESLGYSVLTAESGEEALEILRIHLVDAIVLDYLMPGMNGEETALGIRKLQGDVPIVLSSGCLQLPARVLAIVNASVDKIAGPEPLIAAVEQHLRPLPVETLLHKAAAQEC